MDEGGFSAIKSSFATLEVPEVKVGGDDKADRIFSSDVILEMLRFRLGFSVLDMVGCLFCVSSRIGVLLLT